MPRARVSCRSGASASSAMTRFSSAITRMRNCTNSAFVSGVSSGVCPSCPDAGLAFPSGSQLKVVGTGLVIVLVNGLNCRLTPACAPTGLGICAGAHSGSAPNSEHCEHCEHQRVQSGSGGTHHMCASWQGFNCLLAIRRSTHHASRPARWPSRPGSSAAAGSSTGATLRPRVVIVVVGHRAWPGCWRRPPRAPPHPARRKTSAPAADLAANRP